MINAEVVEAYARGLKKIDKSLNLKPLLEVKKHFHELSLRARVRSIAIALHEALPPYPKALTLLASVVEAEDIKNFALWPATEFVQYFGLEHFDESFAAMQNWTRRFTAEFVVRPFILKQPKKSFTYLLEAAKHENVHLRRWASEGSRPRLPWGERLHPLIADPSPCLKILEILKFDPEIYVRKSVANHLNDISKDHPELVIETLKSWKKIVPLNFEKEFKFILRQSLRTLIKLGNPNALALMGVKHANPALSIKKFNIKQKSIQIGESCDFEFVLRNDANKSTKYVLDYVLYHCKANGSLSPKVFKLKTGQIPGNSELKICKRHSFKPVTTRVYYSGKHKIQLQLNGREKEEATFLLLMNKVNTL